ncbi:MAG: DUF2088 domain-containing protein [Candidatus Eremiobacteraeota bacterium]|nr:DUF2088 domain-containing protein [Candidatus Eremiobacteraeota bacterium]
MEKNVLTGEGSKTEPIDENSVNNIISTALKKIDLKNQRLLLIVPDKTRHAPLPLIFRGIYNTIGQIAEKIDVMIALGTHRPMTEDEILHMFNLTKEEKNKANVAFINHQWDNPGALAKIGTIHSDEVKKYTNGLLTEDIPVTINRKIFDYDRIFIIGPTFPHEVAGFSGGAKYFFPGISGPDIIHFFHWVGALITNIEINGIKKNPVREIIEKCASMVSLPVTCFSIVVNHEDIHGLFIGDEPEAWSAAVNISKQVHIEYSDRPYKKILGICPPIYEDLWTGAKVMYKLEHVVEDGGDLIIYAPHIKEISFTHGELIEKIGYHTRDYFIKQWGRFKNFPWGILAHSTHLKGTGTYENGIETSRINVILSTGIPKDLCKKINLGYLDPAKVSLQDWKKGKDKLLVRDAGIKLFKLKKNGRTTI